MSSNKKQQQQPFKQFDSKATTPSVEVKEELQQGATEQQQEQELAPEVKEVLQVTDVKETPVTPVVEKTEVPKAVVKEDKKGFTPVLKVELDLVSYAEHMDHKKSITPEEGAGWQHSLYTTIKGIFAAKDQETFSSEFNTALNFFHKNKDGVFNENFIFRFPHHWQGSSTEFTFFRRILTVMIQTADPKGRKAALKDLTMEKVVEGLTEQQKQYLFSYYGI